MDSRTREVCQNCKHWLRCGDSYGQCRRYAPCGTATPRARSEHWQNWSLVEDKDWCGEFEAEPAVDAPALRSSRVPDVDPDDEGGLEFLWRWRGPGPTPAIRRANAGGDRARTIRARPARYGQGF